MSRMWVDMGTLPSVPQGAGREAGGGAQVSNRRPTAAKLNASKVREMRQDSLRLCWALLAHPGPRTTQALHAHALNTQDLLTHLGSLCPCPPHPTPPHPSGLASHFRGIAFPCGESLPRTSKLQRGGTGLSLYPGGGCRRELWYPPPGRTVEWRRPLLPHSGTVA